MLLARGEIRRLTTGGPILGAFREVAFGEETLHVGDRETLVFTNGVIDALNLHEEEFSEDRLLARLSSEAGTPEPVLLNRVLVTCVTSAIRLSRSMMRRWQLFGHFDCPELGFLLCCLNAGQTASSSLRLPWRVRSLERS